MDIYEARRLAVQRLIDARYGGTQSAFCEDTGISPSYVSRMLKAAGEKSRKRIGDDTALRIEDALGLAHGTILLAKGSPERGNTRVSRDALPEQPFDRMSTGPHQVYDSEDSGTLTPSTSSNAALPGLRRPAGRQVVSLRLMDVEASMGNGKLMLEHEDVITTMAVDEAWLRRNASFTSPDNLALVTGVGDSMRPTFEDGDPLLVDRGITDIKVDSIYVLALKEELYIKRLQRRPDGSLLMLSDNQAYQPYSIANIDRDQFRVLGRVVMAWNSRRI